VFEIKIFPASTGKPKNLFPDFMKIQLTVLFINLITFSIAQTNKIQGPIQFGEPYDTIYLKNETKIIYSATDNQWKIRILNSSIDTLFRTISMNESKSYLGWVKADFEDYFVMYTDQEGFDYMYIYKKQNGKILAHGSVIKFDTTRNIICYADWNKKDILYLFDFTSSTFEKYIFPTVPCLHWWYCIKGTEVTEKQLIIDYTGKNNSKLKAVFDRKKSSP
jgi:hypothetical protein